MKANFHPEEIKYMELVNDVFNNHPRGQDLINKWKEQFLCAPCCPADYTKAPDYYPYIREGENKFIRHIMNSLIKYDLFKQQQRGNDGTDSTSGF